MGRSDSSHPADDGTASGEITAALLTRANAGDEAAREVLFRRHLPVLTRWSSGRLPRKARGIQDTDDIVQDALRRALARLKDFEPRGRGAFLAYLRLIVTHLVRDEIRGRRRRPDHLEFTDQIAATGGAPLDTVTWGETLDEYEAALGGLTTDQRDAVTLRVELGLSYDDIALRTRSPNANAARSLVVRGIARLARLMRPGE